MFTPIRPNFRCTNRSVVVHYVEACEPFLADEGPGCDYSFVWPSVSSHHRGQFCRVWLERGFAGDLESAVFLGLPLVVRQRV